jgi:hypothetical protein
MDMDEVPLERLQPGGPFDAKDPRSLYNIMPPECRRTVDNMGVHDLLQDEPSLERKLNPTPILNSVRIAFWQEYDMAQSTLTSMTVSGIKSHLGKVSESVLVREYLCNPVTLPWILIPPRAYDEIVEETLSRGLRRLNEVLTLPLTTPTGEVDHETAKLILKTVAFLDVRKNGMPTQHQHVTQDVRQLSVTMNQRDVKKLGLPTRSDELDRKIRELEERLKLTHGK